MKFIICSVSTITRKRKIREREWEHRLVLCCHSILDLVAVATRELSIAEVSKIEGVSHQVQPILLLRYNLETKNLRLSRVIDHPRSFSVKLEDFIGKVNKANPSTKNGGIIISDMGVSLEWKEELREKNSHFNL